VCGCCSDLFKNRITLPPTLWAASCARIIHHPFAPTHLPSLDFAFMFRSIHFAYLFTRRLRFFYLEPSF
ncbi:MAG TPA: hypothetical protein VKS99_17185, partial [Blastocatellia bacterium]|nr:hypothetical protein [Blastocatellia bacterium]